MSRFQPDWVSLGLSSAGFVVMHREEKVHDLPWTNPSAEASSAEWTQRMNVMQDAVRQVARGRVRVTLAPDLICEWTMTPPAGVRSLKELRLVAALQFENAFGLDRANWAIDGDWHWGRPSVCRALPLGLVTGLRGARSHQSWANVDLASADMRLFRQAPGALLPRFEPTVQVAVILDQAVLRWRQHGTTHKVGRIGVDPAHPWPRIGQEIRRVGSLWADEVVPAALDWVSALPISAGEVPGLRCVPAADPPLQANNAVWSRAHVAAALGSTHVG